jgi:CRISPR-associated exonuclease Cas4/CRISPR-associated protein Cas1
VRVSLTEELVATTLAAVSALRLSVQTPGARIGCSGEQVIVTVEREAERRVALGEVSELILTGPVALTTPALHEAVRREIAIAWMSSGFWFLATTGTRGPRSAAARRAQYEAVGRPGSCVALCTRTCGGEDPQLAHAA